MSFDFNTMPTGAKGEAIMEALSTGVDLSNRAVQAIKQKRFEDSARLHNQALQLKLEAFGPNSTHAAISYNGVGEALIRCNRIPEAREAIEKALHVRDYKEFGGLQEGPRDDAAYSRENMACVLEAEGKFEEAREQRLRGEKMGEIACANYDCPSYTLFKRPQLKQCSGCHSVFYHNPECQKADWTSRHKTHCKAYQARQQ